MNFDVMMKYLGVDWIGVILGYWIVKRVKYFLDEINECLEIGFEELFLVFYMIGVILWFEKNVIMFMVEDYIGLKFCYFGDLVINIMWVWMGVLGVFDRIGIVSLLYGVFCE